MNKNTTTALKGSAIILMFFHHIFGCPGFIFSDWGGMFAEKVQWLSMAGDICISLYLFCSGVGLYKSYIYKTERAEKHTHLKRILKFLTTYYVILFLVAIPYLIFSGKFEPEYLFVNLFALLHNDEMLYVSFSWYIKVHLTLLLILPLIKAVSGKIHCLPVDGVLHVVLPVLVRKFILGPMMCEETFVNLLTFLVSWAGLLSTWYPYFAIGMLCAKYNIFERINRKTSCVNKPIKIMVCASAIISVIVARSSYFSFLVETVYCFLYAVAFMILTETLKDGLFMKLHVFLGKYSFQYWLLSGMFFLNTVELQPILYVPYNWLFIIVWSFLLLTPFAYLTSKLSEKISHKITSVL